MRTSQLAIRQEVLPGNSVLENFSNAKKYGFDAVELPGRYLESYRDELLACEDKLPLKISSISLGYRGSLLSANEVVRSRCRKDIRDLLDLCAELSATGLVMPPVLHMDSHERLTDPADRKSRMKLEDALLLEQLPELAEYAYKRNVVLMLEPVNQAETDYLYTLAHAVNICNQANHPGLGITADFFHMSLEEKEPLRALRQSRNWLRLFHLSEKPDRTEPAEGGLNFGSAFKVLGEIGYQGSIVIECRSLSGPAREVLPRSAEYLRRLM